MFHLDEAKSRRRFLKNLATSAGAAIAAPMLVSCATEEEDSGVTNSSSGSSSLILPSRRPANWNPIQFNLDRGIEGGAIPEGYHESITGVDGDILHIGKHMPYLAPIDRALVPEGFIGIMMGDPSKGYAQHPNAEDHWYDWVKIKKDGSNEQLIMEYGAWPSTRNNMVLGGGAIEENGGRNTIYLIQLPQGVKAGDTVRVIAHCNKHGEYVDFITL